MQSQTPPETAGFRKIADRIGLALMACLAVAGLFWPRITLSTECLAIGTALSFARNLWRLSPLVVIGCWLFLAAGFVLALIPIQ
jgi:hypothetical protein